MTHSAGGHWRCGGCFTKWFWRTGGSKSLVITGEATLHGGSKQDEYAFLQDNSMVINAKIHVLKIARMINMINGREITKDLLMDVFSTLDDQISAKFSKGVKEVRRVKGYRPTAEELRWTVAHIACEDPSLSLPSSGMDFQAIDLKLCNTHVRRGDALLPRRVRRRLRHREHFDEGADAH